MNLLSMNLKSAIEKLTLILVTAAFLTSSIFAQAKTAANTANVINIREAGVQYEVPQGWRIQQHQDALQITSSDGAVSIIIAVATNDNTEAMIGGLKEYLKKDYQNYKVASQLQEEQINGLKVLIENGSGETSEGVMEWNIAVILGGKRPLIAFTVSDQKLFPGNQADYIKLVQSLRKAL